MIPKFRVYDKRLKLIRTLNYIDFEGKEILYDITDEAPSEIVRDFSEVDIMQSTGMKDSNGKEIYEGDIIQYIDTVEETIRTLLVTFEYGCFWAGVYLLCDTFDPNVELSVIGNKYEEPNLLNRLDANWQGLEEEV